MAVVISKQSSDAKHNIASFCESVTIKHGSQRVRTPYGDSESAEEEIVQIDIGVLFSELEPILSEVILLVNRELLPEVDSLASFESFSYDSGHYYRKAATDKPEHKGRYTLTE